MLVVVLLQASNKLQPGSKEALADALALSFTMPVSPRIDMAEWLEAMEKTHYVQRRMLEAAARRPRSRDDLAERLRHGRF